MKKRVLVILNRLVIGGQSLDTIPLLYRLADDFDILVLYGCREKDEMEASFLIEKFDGIILRPIPTFRRRFNPFRDMAAFFSVLRQIRSFKPQVVHTHGVKSGLFGRVAAWLCRVPCIIHTFHGHHFHSYFSSFVSKLLVGYERAIAKISTKIVAIGPTQKNELVNIYRIVPEKKLAVIPLGIDESLLLKDKDTKRHAFRLKYGIDEATVAIGIVGRIVPVKNYDLFVAVVSEVIKNSPNHIKFFIIGDGAEKLHVQNELSRFGIQWCEGENNATNAPVIFTSWLPEVSYALNGLDIVALTSHNEGTPLSLIEAQFCGKPVVATDVGGVRDTFINNETGFLVSAGDKNAFAEKLQFLAGNAPARVEMGAKAAVFAVKNFSKTQEVTSFKALYNNCSK